MRLPCNKGILIALIYPILTGCLMGPSFHPSSSKLPAHYLKGPPLTKTASTPNDPLAGNTQYFSYAKTIPKEWWKFFQSDALNQLINQGLAHSPSLAAAKATLKEAQENLQAERGLLLFPNVNASLSGQRQLFSEESFGIPASTLFNLYGASVNVGYVLDVWGAARRQVENYAAMVDYEKYQLIAAYLSLTTNIANTSILMASLRSQIKATNALIRAENDELLILKKQLALGAVSELAVLSQETLCAQTKALLPPLKKNLAQTEHALAILLGEFPSEARLPRLRLDNLHLPERLPVSLPSQLVKQRPDIQAAQANLHTASALIGVATANLYPQINLTGSYGWTAEIPNHLFHASNTIWSYGVGLTAPLFEGGALRAKRRAAIAAYEQTLANYQQTVLIAFQNVADTLRAMEWDARELKEQKAAELAAYRSFLLTRSQFSLGAINYLSLLTAEQQYQQALINRIQAEAKRYTDTVALFQAVGGGWLQPSERNKA